MTELTPEVIAAAERLKRNIATHQQEAAELTELREKLAESDLTIADCHHDMAAMNDELAELRTENERLKADRDAAIAEIKAGDEMERRILDLVKENERMRDALISISEYWNGSENNSAMSDALGYIVSTAREALGETK